MASEVSRIESWIYARLTADTGGSGLNTLVNGRIFPYIAPQKADLAYPIVVYNFQAGRDVQGVGIHRVMTRPLYLIKVISKGMATEAINITARSAADRVDELIGKAVSLVHNGYVFTGRREQAVSYLETDDRSQTATQIQYRHVGGLYRIEAYPT